MGSVWRLAELGFQQFGRSLPRAYDSAIVVPSDLVLRRIHCLLSVAASGIVTLSLSVTT
jgi:hypothetical protein